MMTLEEAIDHCEEVAKKECGKCAEEHLQLAKWLKELKERRTIDWDKAPSQVARDIARIVENEQDMRVIAQPEIIRCKDCKHWIPYDWMFSEVWQSQNIADYPEDEIGCNISDMAMKASDFCSRAERREETE